MATIKIQTKVIPMKLLKVPHTLVLLFSMMILAYILTWVLPAGNFDMVTNTEGREVIVPGTFKLIDNQPNLPIWELFTVIPKALGEAQGIIFFLLLIGGSIAILRATGAIDAILGKVLNRFSHRPALLLFMSMFAFMLGSTSIGMAEEYIPLVLILISLCVALKMDTISAVGSMVIGYGLGYGTAILNPFTLLVAQGVAEIPPTSGWEFRAALFIPFLVIGFHHLWSYASKVREDHTASYVHDVKEAQPPVPDEYPPLDIRRKLVLVITLITLVVMVVGIAKFGWYFVELGAVFFVLAIVTAKIHGLSFDEAANIFTKGAAELTGTALLIGFARSIEMILSDGQILHTIVNGLATPLSHLGAELSAVGMLFIQSLLNFFIPSGSGQAYVTMPIMAPISDIVGVSRQVAVLAYQMGDGFMNMIVPTNPVLMGILGMSGIPYGRWFKFIMPLIIKLFIFGSMALVTAVLIGYQ